MTFSVYAIRLKAAALHVNKFAKANPDHVPHKPCVYVGSTALTPEQRYQRHLTGKTGSKWVKDFHQSIHKTLTNKQPKYTTRRDAEFAEFVLAVKLRRKGYAVWTNLPVVPSFYKETHFSASDWHDAPAQFAIITAYATTGEAWTDGENAEADRRLKNTLKKLGVWMTPITGYSPTSGHSELGWAAAIDHRKACDLGQRFKQDAIYYVTNGRLSISYCDERRALVPVGAFQSRLHITQ